MAVGYEGYVQIGGQFVLGTGATAAKARNKLDSTTGYDGTDSGSTDQGIGYPHEYDFDSYDGSANIELSSNFFDSQLKDWIINSRIDPKQFIIQTRKGAGTTGFQRLSECYWNSISIETSAGSAVTSSINFIAWKKSQDPSSEVDYNTVSDRFLSNRTGLLTQLGFMQELSASGDIPALNAVQNTAPIPYWATTIPAFSGTGISPLSWTINFNQDATKLFLCGSQTTVQAPAIVAFGPMTGQLQTEVIVLQSDFIVPNTQNILVNLGGSSFNLGSCQDVSFGDDLKTASDSVPVSLTYDIYGPLS